MYESIQIDQPIEIAEFLDRLQTEGKRIVPDSLVWVEHPGKPGLMVAAVQVIENTAPSARPRMQREEK